MTSIDATDEGQTHTVALEFDLPHPPATVWRALTDPTLLGDWLLPVTGFDVEDGTEFTFRTEPFPGWDGTIECRVVEADAPRRLRYSWCVGAMGLDTEVTFTLTPTDSGTHLLLVQSGFTPDQKRNFGGARYGWRMMGERLETLLGRLS